MVAKPKLEMNEHLCVYVLTRLNVLTTSWRGDYACILLQQFLFDMSRLKFYKRTFPTCAAVNLKFFMLLQRCGGVKFQMPFLRIKLYFTMFWVTACETPRSLMAADACG